MHNCSILYEGSPSWESKKLGDISAFHSVFKNESLFKICGSCGTRRLVSKFAPRLYAASGNLLSPLVVFEGDQPVLVAAGHAGDGNNVCKCCFSKLSKHKIPPLALRNGLYFGEIPDVVKVLNLLELKCVAQVILFILIDQTDGG